MKQQQFNYDKETKLNTIGVVQRHILQEQLDKLQSLVINAAETPLSDKCISSLLLQRAERDKRLLDEFEMAILAFMDSDGKISSIVRLQDLMFLMTRISKVLYRIILSSIQSIIITIIISTSSSSILLLLLD